jgi:hypothetical protein
MTSLDAVVQEYLQDIKFQQVREAVNHQRTGSIPHYRGIVRKFIDGTYNLNEFRNALKTLYKRLYSDLRDSRKLNHPRDGIPEMIYCRQKQLWEAKRWNW